MELNERITTFRVRKYDLMACGLGGIAAGCIFTGIGFADSYFPRKIMWAGFGVLVSGAGAIASLASIEIEERERVLKFRDRQFFEAKEEHDHESDLRELYGITEPSALLDASIVPELTAIEPSGLGLYDLEKDAVDEGVGYLLLGNSGSGKTSAACWLLGRLTKQRAAQIIVLDPHGNRNPIWSELGLTLISEFHLIELQLQLLIEELDRRRARTENGASIIVVCDELNACKENFENPEELSKASKRLGSEGRKYDIIFIGLNQSGNCEALGIDSNYRANFLLIHFGNSARKAISQMRDSPEKLWVNSQAYPCCVEGSVPLMAAQHPTHGEYESFKKVGNKPMGLLPVNQLPLTIPLATSSEQNDNFNSNNSLLADESELLSTAKDRGRLTVREAMRLPAGRRLNLDKFATESLFAKWVKEREGSVTEEKVSGGQTRLVFLPY